jgi:NTE family protein
MSAPVAAVLAALKRLTHVLLIVSLAGCAGTLADSSPLPEPSAAPIRPVLAPRPIVALALGGGGARGFAHVGVIKTLESAGIRPDIVVGSSSGSIVAALYAAGMSAAQLEAVADQVDPADLIDVNILDGFRVRGERLAHFVKESLGYRPMEALPRAFAVVATDAETGRMKVFNRGDPGLAVRASSSVPRLFVPPVIAGREYVDGGLVSPVPVKLARRMGADIVIAVDISRIGAAVNRVPLAGAAEETVRPWSRAARLALLNAELAEATVVIRPVFARGGLLDFGQKDEQLLAGEQAAERELPELRRVMAAAGFAGRPAFQ